MFESIVASRVVWGVGRQLCIVTSLFERKKREERLVFNELMSGSRGKAVVVV